MVGHIFTKSVSPFVTLIWFFVYKGNCVSAGYSMLAACVDFTFVLLMLKFN